MMRESGSSGRGASRASLRSNAAPQRSSRQAGGAKPSSNHLPFSLRTVSRWMPMIGKALFIICAVVLLVAGYRAVASASFFRADKVDVTGAQRASAERIAAIAKRKAAAANVWQLDLAELSNEIEKEPWVRAAVVSRVLPDGVRVRITEREPRVVVRTSNGQLMWIDEDAVLLARVAPTDELPPFFLRGYDETLTAAAQAENRRRITEAIKMIREWRQAGVVERISEVNVEDLRDVRAQLAGRDAAVEVRLGASNYGARLEKALEVLDEERDAPGGRLGVRIVRLDATVEKRVIIGVGNGVSMEPAALADENDGKRIEPMNAPAVTSSTPPVSRVAPAANVKRADAAHSIERTRGAKPTPRDKREGLDERKTLPPAAARRIDERRVAGENERRKADREAAKLRATALAQRPRRVS